MRPGHTVENTRRVQVRDFLYKALDWLRCENRLMARNFDRREFLTMSAGLFFAVHGEGWRRAAGDLEPAANGAGRMPLIRELHLKTHKLADQHRFYSEKIGFKVVAETPNSVTFRAGATLLRFEQVADGSQPWYHFAFNIPQNMILAARKWQLERTTLLPIPEHLRDPRFPDDVVNYSHWNAHSIFFYDPAGNVVEYIARHDLKNDESGAFTSAKILCASEIGLIVDDVVRTAHRLEQFSGCRQYRGGSEDFTAVGDEFGLLLVMKRGRILNFQPQSQERAAKVFPTVACIADIASMGKSARAGRASSPSEGKFSFADYPYEVKLGS